MSENLSDKQTWTRLAITIGTLVVVMVAAIAISIVIGG